MSEVVETHPYQFLLGEPLRAFKVEASPSSNEVGDFLAFPLLGFYQLQNFDRSLCVAELKEELLFHGLPADDEGFRKIRIPSKGCPL